MKTTETQRAAREYSKVQKTKVQYFCKGNNEGFLEQFKHPSFEQMGFITGGIYQACYENGRKTWGTGWDLKGSRS